ncbi:CUB and zona pellucida-like domain-containing protein 1 [Hydra vulgaris]|uniref:CUB and zona pellucida-like domain-containing protein 1 n=1 Tax=Hydra vulgaris TaxID=6087 RepID=UPI0002B43871|nr:CUB and zona pellucida-like domain-containing protein 1 [Hydra vulgaris]
MYVKKWLLFLVIGFHFNFMNCYRYKLRCNCNQTQCIEPVGCLSGKVKDACDCCNVCAKTEGERCGGRNHIGGECGKALQCMVRRLRTHNNRKIQEIGALVGRCEHEMCHMVQCPFGKSCFYEKGVASCDCPKCIDMISEPVCGEVNNKDYNNECELRTEECRTGRKIGLIRGTCMAPNISRISCKADSMTIEILKSFIRTNGKHISLFDANCKPKENKTHFIFHTKLNECGTKVAYTLTSVIYSNAIRSVENENNIIVRYRNIKVPFECDYLLQNKNEFQVIFHSNRSKDKPSENRINVRSFQELKSENEKYLVVLKSKLPENHNATLLLRQCTANSGAQSSKQFSYTIISNGCPLLHGLEIAESKGSFIKLLIPINAFRGIKPNQILVKCKIRQCFSNNTKKDFLCTPINCRK